MWLRHIKIEIPEEIINSLNKTEVQLIKKIKLFTVMEFYKEINYF